jgi:predicted PurR-regulated permease PerM
MTENRGDITRTFLAVLSIGVLIGTSLWIIKPFLGAVIWAVTIVTATWPLMAAIQHRLWGRSPNRLGEVTDHPGGPASADMAGRCASPR